MASPYLRGVSVGSRIVGQGFDEYERGQRRRSYLKERDWQRDQATKRADVATGERKARRLEWLERTGWEEKRRGREDATRIRTYDWRKEESRRRAEWRTEDLAIKKTRAERGGQGDIPPAVQLRYLTGERNEFRLAMLDNRAAYDKIGRYGSENRRKRAELDKEYARLKGEQEGVGRRLKRFQGLSGGKAASPGQAGGVTPATQTGGATGYYGPTQGTGPTRGGQLRGLR